jgi:hypothetical protein
MRSGRRCGSARSTAARTSLIEIFDPAHLRPTRTQAGHGPAMPAPETPAVDSADLEQRLRVLGYIE